MKSIQSIAVAIGFICSANILAAASPGQPISPDIQTIFSTDGPMHPIGEIARQSEPGSLPPKTCRTAARSSDAALRTAPSTSNASPSPKSRECVALCAASSQEAAFFCRRRPISFRKTAL